MRRAARWIYALLGTLAIGLGVLVLVQPAAALPPDIASPQTAHLIREQGAEGIFIGLMAFWCLFHFEQRRPVHLALLLFAALFAAIHWSEYLQDRRHVASPLLNSLPFLALLATAPFTRDSGAGSDEA